ncbi:ABC transporter ATP-binding protein [Geopsychrobacter electrodiphilus]|uniref:ABC transporter ATP-binding protein n=1 Tax=Geopsychrobacter electrodiphilus TaxID=225196 RepID=UPI000366F4A7|nr:ABC transporter ATP-binding protein [Geopsychrobacter electrodiphilus]
MDAIEALALSKTFRGKRGRRVEALTDLSLSVAQGEVFGFLGPNGAGKSTTIKSLVGLIRPSSGCAKIMGLDISCPDARLNVGYLPENPAFYDFLTGVEYLDFVGRAFGLAGSILREKSEQVLKLLDLWESRKRPMRGYSKGMVQRVGLAQVLIHDPDVYILDEPMSGLDPIGRALVKQILTELKSQGKTVFFSTHVTSDIEAVCDRVGVIVGGCLRALSSVEDIMKTGIDGYRVQLVGGSKESFVGFECESAGNNFEVYVPKVAFNNFMMKVHKSGAEVSQIEPNRNNLEDFFLDIVHRDRQ